MAVTRISSYVRFSHLLVKLTDPPVQKQKS
jgi:hypothetical protein